MCYNVKDPKENQAAPQETFGFLGPLTNECPAEQDEEHGVRIRELKNDSAGDIWLLRKKLS